MKLNNLENSTQSVENQIQTPSENQTSIKTSEVLDDNLTKSTLEIAEKLWIKENDEMKALRLQIWENKNKNLIAEYENLAKKLVDNNFFSQIWVILLTTYLYKIYWDNTQFNDHYNDLEMYCLWTWNDELLEEIKIIF